MSEIKLVPRSPLVAEDAEEAFAATLRVLLEDGEEVVGGSSLSTGSQQRSREHLNLTLILTNPRQRLVRPAMKRLNLPAAVARFVWMMAGSDRLADIEYYEPKVRHFSDDGVSIPGSNYGERMLQPRPGLNQLAAVMSRLRADQSTRRAAVSIYHPEDAVRDSKDIPCTFGLMYHIRGGAVNATTIMRSNNAYVLLPYNLFEFSLLAEAVATDLSLPLGHLTHFAVSMHVYDRDLDAVKDTLRAAGDVTGGRVEIPSMPASPAPLEQIRELVILEAQLRLGSAGVEASNIEEWLQRGGDRLHPYWAQYFYLLLQHVARQNRDQGALDVLAEAIDEPWRSYLPDDAFVVEGAIALDPQALLHPRFGDAKVIPFYSTRLFASLKGHVKQYEATSGKRVGWEQFSMLQERLGQRLAARSDEAISEAEFREAIESLSV